jgi:hypothetical protein
MLVILDNGTLQRGGGSGTRLVFIGVILLLRATNFADAILLFSELFVHPISRRVFCARL